MIQLGNQKLGRTIWHWSIPAITTCPGATPTCILTCYATRGRYVMPGVDESLTLRFRLARQEGFAAWLLCQLRTHGVQLLRLHAAGDFYDVPYTRAWLEVVRKLPGTTFFGYTRSWRVPELLPLLEELAALPNMRLFWSEDKDTGPSPATPDALRCYLSISDDDVPSRPQHLVFRNNPRTTRKKVGGSLVCPHEQLQPYKPTCDACRLCFTQQGWDHLRRQAQRKSCPPQPVPVAPPG